MLTKEKVDKTIKNLPETFTLDELIDQLIFMEKVEEGIGQADTGRVISNEEIRLILEKWSR